MAYLIAVSLLPATQSDYGEGTQLKPRSSEFSQIFWMLSTVTTPPFLSHSTSPRRSTLLITEFCWNACGSSLASIDNTALAWFRSYLSGRRQHIRCGGKCYLLMSSAVYHKDRSLDRFSSLSTHVHRTVSRCFAALRQLRHLRRYVTDDC